MALNEELSVKVKEEPLNNETFCEHLQESYVKQDPLVNEQELVEPLEECLLDLDRPYNNPNGTWLTPLLVEDPFKDCVPSKNDCKIEPLDGDFDNKFSSVTPAIIIKEETDIKVLQVEKSKPCRRDNFPFYNTPNRDFISSNLTVIPKIIRPQINKKHLCGTAVTVLCPECNMCFQFAGLLREHLKSSHGLKDVPMFHCSQCKGDFNDIYDLMSHIKKESGQILVYCRFCDYSFVIRKHAGIYQHRTSFYVKRQHCKICLKVFRTPEFLKRHFCTVTEMY